MKRFRNFLFYTALITLLIQEGQVTAAGPIGVDLVTVVITESNWIGINTKDLTGQVHVGTIGINTEVLTEEGGQTKWIGKNTQYITEVVQTATISGAPTTFTNFPNLQIVGPVGDDGNPTGSFDLIMAPALAAQVQELADKLCSKKRDEGGECSADFIPRVQSLLKSGNGVLTERNLKVYGSVLMAVVAIVLDRLAGKERVIPLKIHADHDSYRSASLTTIASSYVVTFTSIPKVTQVLVSDLPQATFIDANDDSCWLYVGVDVEPLSEDDISEASEDDEPAKKRSLILAAIDEFLHNTELPDVDTRKLRRGIAGRISLPESEFHTVSKRDGKIQYIDKIGMCDTRPSAHSIIRAQRHPTAGMSMAPFSIQSSGRNNGIDPKMWWFVPEQDPEDLNDPCVIAKLTKQGKKDPTSPDISKENFPAPYDQSVVEKILSIDHIYELSTIQDFFVSEFNTPHDSRCKAFVEMFDKPDTGLQKGQKSRFYSLWAQNPNPTPGNWAFAGVDQRINNLKGKMLNPGLNGWPNLRNVDGSNADKSFDFLFQTWNNAGLSIDFINNADVSSYFSERNSAVYAAFRDFDSIQDCEKDKNDKSESTNWAETYKNYITGLLTTNEGLIQGKIQEIIQKIDEQKDRMKDKRGRPNKYGRAYASLKSIFPVSHFKFAHTALLKFPDKSLGIRDAKSTGTCLEPEPPVPCVERTIVNCIYHYKDRPDLSISDCPPVPVLPASCSGGPSTPPATAEPAPIGYCVPVDDGSKCTLATNFRHGEEPAELMGKNAFIYDHECNEIGHSKGIKSGTSMGSQLPYTVEIEYYETGGVLSSGERLLVLQFSYAAQTKGQWVAGNTRRDDCTVTNYSIGSVEHRVNRCPFDCSAKKK